MADDKGPLTLGLIWMFATLSGIFLGLRLYCKWIKLHRFWWDDNILIASWVCTLAAISLESASIPYGLGKHIGTLTGEQITMQVFLGNVTIIFAMGASSLSKTSFAVTLLRIVNSYLKYLVWFIIVSVNSLYFANILYSWFRCSPIPKLWDNSIDGTCSDVNTYETYSLFVASYSAFMDLVLALLPTVIVWNLQMKLKEKIGVAVAMSMGVFGGITAAVKAYQIYTFSDPDSSYALVSPIIWGTAEANITIIAASIPVLRSLIAGLGSRRGYYNHGDHNSADATGRMARPTRSQRTVPIGNTPKSDRSSERSIIHAAGAGGGIAHTREFTLQSGHKTHSDDELMSYEMVTV